ncbi:MAG: hypothetical protein ACI4PP_00210 [Clostridia bacterium]
MNAKDNVVAEKCKNALSFLFLHDTKSLLKAILRFGTLLALNNGIFKARRLST